MIKISKGRAEVGDHC